MCRLFLHKCFSSQKPPAFFGAFILQKIFGKNQCADCSFIGICRKRVRTLRFVLSFPSCNAGCCVFFEYCLMHTRQNAAAFFDVKSKAPDVKSKALYITVIKRTGFARFLLLRRSRRRKQTTGNASASFSPKAFPAREKRRLIHIFVNIRPLCVAGSALRKNSLCTAGTGVPVPAPTSSSAYESTYKHRRNPRFQQPRRQINRSFSTR